MRDAHLSECERIRQDSEYTAEAHHIIAAWFRRFAYALQLVPAVVAAATSALVVADVRPTDWLYVTVVSAVIAATANILNPNALASSHLSAAKGFTVLKSKARYLASARSKVLSDEALAMAVDHLHERYNDAVRSSPPTGTWAFHLGSKRIKAGVHLPDE